MLIRVSSLRTMQNFDCIIVLKHDLKESPSPIAFYKNSQRQLQYESVKLKANTELIYLLLVSRSIILASESRAA